MRILGFILAASIALAALRIALVGLYLLALLSLIMAAIFKPRETLAMLTFFVIVGLLQVHPLAVMGTVVALCAIGAIARHFGKR